MMSTGASGYELINFAAGIVSAHISHNDGPVDGLPDFIRSVYAALSTVGSIPTVNARPEPAVRVERSVFPNYIVCLEDGMRLKMLKRHLQSSYGLTPAAYRTRWNLPVNYPMVSPNYASYRSTLAKSSGLGRKRKQDAAADVPPQQTPAASPGHAQADQVLAGPRDRVLRHGGGVHAAAPSANRLPTAS